MKKIVTLITACIISVASYAQDKGAFYGEKFEQKTPVDIPSFIKTMKEVKGTTVKINDIQVKGTIDEVCQSAGCWIRLKNPDGESVFVKFKNHFTIPMDLAGSSVIVYGTASKKTVSVKDQKHFAEDANKSDEDIAKITSPKDEIRIDASGIWIEKN